MSFDALTGLGLFGKNLLRHTHGFSQHRDARVDSALEQNFADLCLGASVVQRTANVGTVLLRRAPPDAVGMICMIRRSPRTHYAIARLRAEKQLP
ncbi:MAG: hypothetical protein ACXWCX_19840 [Burkholderiales bacterium]